MKELLVIRHAKSGWGNIMDPDFDRVLTEQGHRDAIQQAAKIKEQGIAIETFLSSTATRALITATHFANMYDIDPNKIEQIPSLYHASAETFYEVVAKIPSHVKTVAIFSHNPGITDFVNSLCDTRIDIMPPCGIFAIRIPIDSWDAFENAERTFWFFDQP